MTAVWASRHEDLVSHGVVSPHVCDPMVVPHWLGGARSGNSLGSAWTPVLTLPHRRDGLRVLLMAVLCPFHRLSMCRPVHRQFLRNALLDLTTIVPTTAYHQSNYAETYSRSMVAPSKRRKASTRP
jgi:hypothetical protein